MSIFQQASDPMQAQLVQLLGQNPQLAQMLHQNPQMVQQIESNPQMLQQLMSHMQQGNQTTMPSFTPMQAQSQAQVQQRTHQMDLKSEIDKYANSDTGIQMMRDLTAMFPKKEDQEQSEVVTTAGVRA